MSKYLTFSDRILKLIEIFGETFDFKAKTFTMSYEQEKEFNSLWESVVE